MTCNSWKNLKISPALRRDMTVMRSNTLDGGQSSSSLHLPSNFQASDLRRQPANSLSQTSLSVLPATSSTTNTALATRFTSPTEMSSSSMLPNIHEESLNNMLPDSHVSCHICSKIFRGVYCKYNLKKHQTIHSGIRPFVCSLCQRTFNQKSSMRRHVARIHGISESSINTGNDFNPEVSENSIFFPEHFNRRSYPRETPLEDECEGNISD